MLIKFPFVRGGKCYTIGNFDGNFVCYECGSELDWTPTMENSGVIRCINNPEHDGIKPKEETDMANTKVESKMPVNLDEITTMTGLKVMEAIEKLNERLEDSAYREIQVGSKERGFTLTDIGPAYLLEKLKEVLGPFGVGWRYVYHRDNITVTPAGNSSIASLIGLEFYYTLVWDKEAHEIGPAMANGSSKNSSVQFALKGAVTNALGNAVHRALNWQIDVYKGIRTHLGDGEIKPNVTINFLDAMSLHTNIEKMKDLSIQDTSIAPAIQYMLLKTLDENAPVTSIPEVLSEDVWKAMWSNYSRISKEEKCGKDFTEEMTGKEFKELTIGEFRVLWTSICMIASGEKRTDVVKRMKAFVERDS